MQKTRSVFFLIVLLLLAAALFSACLPEPGSEDDTTVKTTTTAPSFPDRELLPFNVMDYHDKLGKFPSEVRLNPLGEQTRNDMVALQVMSVAANFYQGDRSKSSGIQRGFPETYIDKARDAYLVEITPVNEPQPGEDQQWKFFIIISKSSGKWLAVWDEPFTQTTIG
ncbi:MAG: hypothetical protein LBB67_02855 [Oscillospiraceae bacterium]|jgi:hypothetical protein|nr:hypothetical protein [Oscillospiraceae bacterium]